MKTAETLNKGGKESVHSTSLNPASRNAFFGGHGSGFFGGLPIQAKLRVGAPNDRYEVEADAMADRVMRMPESQVQRKCSSCEDEEKLHRKPLADSISPLVQRSSKGAGAVSSNTESSITSSVGSGSTLPDATRSFMESRFGTDFSGVNIHTGSHAQQLNTQLGARAFTYGNDIFFNRGEYNPSSREGKHLLAHELTHVVQQKSKIIQRFEGCTSDQDTTISNDHDLAISMLSTSISKLSSYNGSRPTEVYNALNTHFNGNTSSVFGAWIQFNLSFLKRVAGKSYNCFAQGYFESKWACPSPRTLATAFWCVPGVNIRLCPLYFGQSPIERAETLIHEWVHKYGCNFDLGYEWDKENYDANSTLTQLLNADSFSSFVKDIS